MARKQYETDFIAELKKSVLHFFTGKSFYYKIPDDMIYSKPFDVFASFGGKHFALEMKVHRTHNAFPLSKIPTHQVSGLLGAEVGGYKSYVLIQVIYKTDKVNKNFVSVITTDDIDQWECEGVKSVTVEELEKNSFTKKRVEELKTSLWDIETLT